MAISDNFEFIDIFEEKLCDFTGFKHAVTVDCCTNAILLSLDAKLMFNEINKADVLYIPAWTYMSVPMTLKLNGWRICLDENQWNERYSIEANGHSIEVFDCAVCFFEGMAREFNYSSMACISFQQKKRLSLGRGGAILFNDAKYETLLKRLRYDGRNIKLNDEIEVAKAPKDIICGRHCYLEPDKAAAGILKINQKSMLPKYIQMSWRDYPDLRALDCLK